MRVCSICQEDILPYSEYTKPHKGNMGIHSVHKKCRDKVDKSKAKELYTSRAKFKKYGITMGQYYDMMFTQSGCCKICKRPVTNMRLAIDHDHKTGDVRGLLCNKCNSMIGFANDDPDILIEAANYLRHTKRHNCGVKGLNKDLEET